MFRLAILTLATGLLLTTLSCSTYSSGLQKSLVFADEAAATGTLRAVAIAQQSYSATNSGSYGTFQELVGAGFLDSRFGSEKPTIKDYAFAMETGKDASGFYYKCTADPTKVGGQAGRHFYVDSSSTALHVNATQTASATDPEYFQ
jgi:hypothetical protein